MSGLSYICEYNSESETSDIETCQVTTKRPKLPKPNLSKINCQVTEIHTDNPDNHCGRTRRFPHVRGNWATFVYINCASEDNLETIISNLQCCITSQNKSWYRCDNIHISLSKTFVLSYHLINPFITSLSKAVSEEHRFILGFSGNINIYCNDDKTRTFIALEVDNISKKYLTSLTEKVNESLKDYKLPIFYEDPSFHMSIFWTNGSISSLESEHLLKELNKVISIDIDNVLKDIEIDTVHCKTGNKHYQHKLK